MMEKRIPKFQDFPTYVEMKEYGGDTGVYGVLKFLRLQSTSVPDNKSITTDNEGKLCIKLFEDPENAIFVKETQNDVGVFASLTESLDGDSPIITIT